MKAWVAGGYKGITDTTRILLNHWFYTDHKLATGARSISPFATGSDRDASLCLGVRESAQPKALLERYARTCTDLRLPPYDEFARYCIKMATGSGKTKVMSLAIAWQFLNAAREAEEVAKDYAKTFLILAPNVIVLERLKTDFAGGRIFARTQSSRRTGNLLGLRLRHARRSRKSALPKERCS